MKINTFVYTTTPHVPGTKGKYLWSVRLVPNKRIVLWYRVKLDMVIDYFSFINI